MAQFDALYEAYVRLRPQQDGSFEDDARQQILPGLKRIAGDAALLFAGKKLLDVGVAGLDELKQSQQVTAQTTLELKNLGSQTNVTSDQVDALGQHMLDLAGIDDEVGRTAANVLLRFKAITDSATLTRVENDAADLAVTMGTQLPEAARTLGLALEDPLKAVRLLRSANIILDASQQDALKSAVAVGDQATVNAIVLGSLEKSIGGAAKAYGDTLAGAEAKATENLKNAKAELVQGFAPAVQVGAELVSTFAKGISSLPPVLQEVGGGLFFVGGETVALLSPLSNLVNVITQLRLAREASAAAALVDAAATDAEAVSQTGLALSSLGALGAFGGLALAVGGAAVGIAAVTGILNDNSNQIVDAKSATDAYTQALKENSAAAIDNATAGQLAGTNATDGAKQVAQAYLSANIPIQTFYDQVHRGTSELDNFGVHLSHNANIFEGTWQQALRGAAASGNTFAQGLIKAYDAGTLTEGQVIAIIKAANNLSGNLGDATAASALFAGVVASTGDSVDATTGKITDQASALKDAKDAAKNLQDVYQSLIDSTLSQFGAALDAADAAIATRKALQDLADQPGAEADKVASLAKAVSDAEKSVADAQTRLGAAKTDAEKKSATDALTTANDQLAAALKRQSDGALTASESQDALQSKTDAALKAINAQAKAAVTNADAVSKATTGVALSAKDQNDILIFSYAQIESTLAPDSPLRATIDGYIAQLQNVPADVSTAFHADTEAALHALDDYLDSILAAQRGLTLDEFRALTQRTEQQSATNRTVTQHATGGWMRPGEVSTVNEDGTESWSSGGRDYLLAGHNGGMVRSAADTARQGGNHVTLNVHEGAVVINESGKGAGRDTIDELRYFAAMATGI